MGWINVKWFCEDVCDFVTDTVSDGFDVVTDFINEKPKTSIAIGATASGTAIATLEGAALSSASLAAIGGGSVAVGGACVVATG